MFDIWALIPMAAILGFWFFLISVSQAKARVRELQVRERIALIEKGMMPAPEVDPRGFERAAARYEYRRSRGTGRHRSAGITLIGVGLGLAMMIAFAGEDPQKALGIGGFIVMLGLAFLINSIFEQRQLATDEMTRTSAVSSSEGAPKTDSRPSKPACGLPVSPSAVSVCHPD